MSLVDPTENFDGLRLRVLMRNGQIAVDGADTCTQKSQMMGCSGQWIMGVGQSVLSIYLTAHVKALSGVEK